MHAIISYTSENFRKLKVNYRPPEAWNRRLYLFVQVLPIIW